jgi:hypothetical protein
MRPSQRFEIAEVSRDCCSCLARMASKYPTSIARLAITFASGSERMSFGRRFDLDRSKRALSIRSGSKPLPPATAQICGGKTSSATACIRAHRVNTREIERCTLDLSAGQPIPRVSCQATSCLVTPLESGAPRSRSKPPNHKSLAAISRRFRRLEGVDISQLKLLVIVP